MDAIGMRRRPTDPELLEVTSESDSSTDTDDDSETSNEPLLRKTTTITGKSLCLKGLLTLLALLFAAAVLATIFYFIGVGPWYLTHTRVTYGHSKYATFNCWNTSTTAIFVPWDNETSIQNRTGLFAKNNGKKYVESRAFNLNDSTLDDLLNRTWEIYAYDFLDTEALCWIRVLQRKERRTVRCNWIHPDRGFPEWHCNMACRSLLLLPNQGYWDTEVVYPAPHRSSGCRAWLPRGEFWGDYHLNCRTDDIIPTAPTGNWTYRNASRGNLPVNATISPTPANLTNMTAFLIRQGPRRFMYQAEQQHCYKHHFLWLNPCLWNKFVKCAGQNYIVSAIEEYWADFWHSTRPLRTEIETWLNNTFPWTYIAEEQTFFMGDFPEGTVRSHTGLTELHIANLQEQIELRTALQNHRGARTSHR
ncbi:uncharacterized protein LOC116729509 [Xiphophorus hellerii]|uniref:uncharacterized protein LOC116729509 n=1 Tax=Xiphophorus hellerii TaxID=8084 RepID=UPI0013B45AAA|nr:uncharacterized protein LOC116729509 [Xiphophorus hellerii]